MARLPDYTHVDYPEPHIGRTTRILKDHPEIAKLFGYTPSTAFWTLGVVGFQVAMAAWIGTQAWWVILLASFFVGAFANHSLFAIIHDCAHNLAFKKSPANKWLSIFANLPIIFPCAIMFRGYHLLHHRYQGEFNYDADLPGPKESAFFGNTAFGKASWLFLFFVVEGLIRPTRLKEAKLYDGWAFLNVVIELLFLGAIVFF